MEISRFAATPLPLPPYRRFVTSANLQRAELASKLPAVAMRKPRSTVVQKRGNKYESKAREAVKKLLDDRAEYRYIVSPWFSYTVEDTTRHCQPDLLVFSASRIYIIEIKLTHVLDAYYQMKYLYLPVVQHIFPGYEISLVELTRSFDPRIGFPEEFYLMFDFYQALKAELPLSVVQWKL